MRQNQKENNVPHNFRLVAKTNKDITEKDKLKFNIPHE